jgi:hypothetical protein
MSEISIAAVAALQFRTMKKVRGDLMNEIRTMDPKVARNRKIHAGFVASFRAGAGFFSFLNNVDGKPHDALVGLIPLDIVTYYDFAESDSVVKYRAFGGEFFAHQGGDKTALRIDFMLVGPGKDVWINALRMLRLACKSTTRGQTLTNQDESYLFEPINARGEGLWTFKTIQRREANLNPSPSTGTIVGAANAIGASGNVTPSQAAQILATLPDDIRELYTIENIRSLLSGRLSAEVTDLADERSYTTSEYFSTVPANQVDPLSIQRMMTTDDIFNGWRGEYAKHSDQYYKLQQLGYYTYHFNFPVIIDNLVFPSMWLETVQFTKDSRNGVDAIVGHVLLRKYIKPPRIRWTANGGNPSRLASRRERDNNGNVKSTRAIDKWVWIWQDKRSPLPQVAEYGTQIVTGIMRAAMRNSQNPYKYLNASIFQQQYRAINSSVSFPAL